MLTLMSVLALSGAVSGVQEPRDQPSRVCVAILEGSEGSGDSRLAAATAHCRSGDVLDFYDRSSAAITDYNVARICDLRYPVRPINAPGVSAAFQCIYNGTIRSTVRAGT